MATTTEPAKTIEMNEPVWRADTPVRFDQRAAEGRAYAIRRWLAGEGRMPAEFTSAVDRVGGRGVWVVKISEPGPRMMIGRMAIKGLKRNSEPQLLSCMQVREGDAIDLSVMKQLHQRLRDCGRFTQYDLAAEPMLDQPGQMVLTVDLEELADGPVLGEKLSDTEQAALKFVQWMNGLPDRGDDLVMVSQQDKRGRMMVVWSPHKGLGVNYEPNADAEDALLDRCMQVVATSEGIWFNAPDMGLREVLAPTQGRYGLVMTLYGRVDAKADSDKPSTMGFTLGLKDTNDTVTQGLLALVDFAPSWGLHLVHAKDAAARIEDGRLKMTIGDSTFEVDAASGRLLNMEKHLADGKGRMSIVCRPGALDEMITAMRKQMDTEPPPNQFATTWGRFARWVQIVNRMFAHSSLLNLPPEQRRQISEALEKWLAPGTFDALATELTLPADPNRQRFSIPADRQWVMKLAGNPMSMLQIAVPYCDDVFVRGSWPWTLGRESILMMTGGSQYTMTEVRRLLASQDVGPIGGLAVSRWLKLTQPSLSRAFARMSRDKLTEQAFLADCHMLLDPDRIQGKFALAMLANLQRMSDADVEHLGLLLPKDSVAWLKVLHDALKAAGESGQPLDQQVLDRIALRVWQAGLKDAVTTGLADLARDPSDTPAPPPLPVQ